MSDPPPLPLPLPPPPPASAAAAASACLPLASPPPSPTHAQLAALLTNSYREKESLHKELAAAKRRLDSLERQLAVFPKSSSPSASVSEAAQRAIQESEARAERAELARDEAEARRHRITEAWEDLHRQLDHFEVRAHDARNNFARIISEGGGSLVLAPIPVLGSLSHHHPSASAPPSAPSPAIMLVPPPHSHSRSHRHSSSTSSQQGLPPPPSRVRPRSGSFDDPSFLPAHGQPPSKRSRTDHDHRPSRHPPDRTHLSSLHHLSIHQPPSAYPPRPRPSHSHSRSSSRSSQRSLSIDEMLLEASTDDPRPRNADPQSPRTVLAHHQHPLSARGLVGHPSTPGAGPLDQPGELRTYQTHIFAPPVTGAPTKKGKPSVGMPNGATLPTPPTTASAPTQAPTVPLPASSSSNLAPHPAASPSHPPLSHQQPQPQPPPPRTPQGTYPATNSLGQRICRQCGLAGRYKEGKCVEKWGPGPEGPGTVCDRCRKKMKRVERRGTMGIVDPHANDHSQQHAASQMTVQQLQNGQPLVHAHTMPARMGRTDTIPAHAMGPNGAGSSSVSSSGPALGPGGTQIMSSSPGFGVKRERTTYAMHSQPHVYPSSIQPSQPQQIRSGPPPAQTQQMYVSAKDSGSVTSGPREGSGSVLRDLPSPPPAIATLPQDDDDAPASKAPSSIRPGSMHLPPLKRSDAASYDKGRSRRRGDTSTTEGHGEGERDAEGDGDADADAEGDVDADGDGSQEGASRGSREREAVPDADMDPDADVDHDVDADADADADGEVEGESEREEGEEGSGVGLRARGRARLRGRGRPRIRAGVVAREGTGSGEDARGSRSGSGGAGEEGDNSEEGEVSGTLGMTDKDKDAERDLLEAVDAAERERPARSTGGLRGRGGVAGVRGTAGGKASPLGSSIGQGLGMAYGQSQLPTATPITMQGPSQTQGQNQTPGPGQRSATMRVLMR